MKKSPKIAASIVFFLALVITGSASAAPSLRQPGAVRQFDRLALGYQRHLTSDSYSRVNCRRIALKSFRCRGRWKVTAKSDEGIRTRFTFKARGTVIRRDHVTIARARFVKWETVKGVTKKTSTVSIAFFDPTRP